MSNPYWPTRPVPPVFSDPDVHPNTMHMPRTTNPTKVEVMNPGLNTPGVEHFGNEPDMVAINRRFGQLGEGAHIPPLSKPKLEELEALLEFPERIATPVQGHIRWEMMSPMEIVDLHAKCEQRIDKARRDLLGEAIRRAGGQRKLAKAMNYAVENLNHALNGGRSVGAALTERVVKYLQGATNG